MHPRRSAALLLGGWLAGSLLMMLVATQNFRSVDRLLSDPSARAKQSIQTLGHEESRALLRHHASEQNRWYFESWERIELALGTLLIAAIFLADPRRRRGMFAAGVMLAAVALTHWVLTPEIARLGRTIDFTAAAEAAPARDRFALFHSAHTITELVKLGLGAVLAVQLLKRRRARRAEGLREIAPVEAVDH
jgi:hypothetical protein